MPTPIQVVYCADHSVATSSPARLRAQIKQVLQEPTADPGIIYFPENELSIKEQSDFTKSIHGVRKGRQALIPVRVVTRSFWIISGVPREAFRVLKDGRIQAAPEFQTFGSAYEYLSCQLSGIDYVISGAAVAFMKQAIDSGSIEKARSAISSTGESMEKRFLFEAVARFKKKGCRMRTKTLGPNRRTQPL